VGSTKELTVETHQDLPQDNPRYSLGEIVREFKLSLEPEPKFPDIQSAIADVQALNQNPLYRWMTQSGLLEAREKPNDGGWYRIRCPLVNEHTDAVASGTGIRFSIDGSIAFHCFHSHGDRFRTRQFLDWVVDQSGPVVSVSSSFSWEEPDVVLLAPDKGILPEPPLDALPKEWRDWVEKTSAGAGAPPAFMLLGLFAAAAGVCGAGFEVRIGAKWTEPLVLWLMMVALPSSGKSPALAAMRQLLTSIESRLRNENLNRQTNYNADLLAMEMAKVAHKKGRKEQKPLPPVPPKPEKPQHLQLAIGNTTIEALAAALMANPRGLLAIHDELSSLLLNLARYSGGNDRPLYLEAWAAARWIINRKHLDKPIEIPRAAISLFGGIQPERLREFLDSKADDGLAARFLSAWPDPPARVPLWERQGGDDTWAAGAMERIWDKAGTPGNPLALSLDPRAFDPIDERLVERTRREEGFMAGFVGKGRGTIARLAGILTLLEWAATSSPTPPMSVSETALRGATRLWEEFFEPHARAIFRLGGRSDRESRLRKVALYLRDNKLCVFRRETIRVDALKRTMDAPDVDPILRDLEQRGLIRRALRAANGPGRPTAEWEANPRIFH
jgi:hypothetical protein